MTLTVALTLTLTLTLTLSLSLTLTLEMVDHALFEEVIWPALYARLGLRLALG